MYSGSCSVISLFAYGAFTLSGWLSQNHSAQIDESYMQSEPRHARVSVWPLSVSLAATPEIDVSFSSSGYLDVSVPRVPFLTLWIGVRITEVLSVRFPHSDIHGSLVICTSPWLFAAYHVFRRLLVPRHPPCALLCLTSRCIALQHFVLLKKAFLSFYWIFGLLILGCLDIESWFYSTFFHQNLSVWNFQGAILTVLPVIRNLNLLWNL